VRVVLDYRPALRERSGVGEYTHGLAQALLAASAADRLQLTLFSSSWKDRIVLAENLRGARVVDRRVPVSLLNLVWHRAGWPPIELLTRGRFEVAHSMHPLLMPARRAARIVTIHDLHFMTHPERARAEIRRDYPRLARAHAHRADAIVTVSRFTAAEIVSRFEVPAERIAVCPPGAPPWPPRARAPEAGYVLFFGTLEPRKNVGGLLDAYALLAERRRDLPQLILAGKASDAAGPWLERIARAPLAGLVRHVGYISPSQRQALYQGARCLVQPSFDEGFGIPVLEAMTVGVPVIVTDRGALPEVSAGAGPVVPAGDAGALADAIARLLNDPAFAAQCTERGLARAAEFRWDRTARLVYETYQRAIERRGLM
jgi:glycosyltransferase involved in cell wall biosynthesis